MTTEKTLTTIRDEATALRQQLEKYVEATTDLLERANREVELWKARANEEHDGWVKLSDENARLRCHIADRERIHAERVSRD